MLPLRGHAHLVGGVVGVCGQRGDRAERERASDQSSTQLVHRFALREERYFDRPLHFYGPSHRCGGRKWKSPSPTILTFSIRRNTGGGNFLPPVLRRCHVRRVTWRWCRPCSCRCRCPCSSRSCCPWSRAWSSTTSSWFWSSWSYGSAWTSISSNPSTPPSGLRSWPEQQPGPQQPAPGFVPRRSAIRRRRLQAAPTST